MTSTPTTTEPTADAAAPVVSSAPHQALYRRWRAQTFAQMVGQDAVVTTLRNAVRDGRVAHALLFVGPRGTGKTSTARIVAKALNCPNLVDGEPCDRCPSCVAIREGRALDVVEMDAASNNRVDDIRELLPRIYTAPSDLRRKVFIVDEVQRIKEGWDLLLKTLEEPPEHVAFIFCTTDSSGIRPAVLSRVQRFDFRRLTVDQIAGKLRAILGADGRAADDEAIGLVAELAAGGMRDAESMLDQLLASGAERITADQVRDLLGLADADAVDRFVGALVTGDGLTGLRVLDALDERGRDPRVFLDQVVDTIRARLMDDLGRGATAESAVLAAAARRLAAIDPTGPGAGGLRLQLELAVLSPGQAAAPVAATQPTRAVTAAGPAATPARAKPRPSPTAVAPSETPAEAVPTPVEAAASVDGPNPPVETTDEPTAEASEPPTAPVEPPPSVPPGPPAGDDPLEILRQAWPAVVAHISQHPPTRPLISECRPIAVDGNVVTLGFPESKAFLKDVADRRRANLEEGIGKFLGRTVAVRCVATNLDVFPPLPGDEDGDRLLTEARRIFADDLADVGEVS